ncbi:acetyltransferase, GNAT superfamily protein [Acanthamoeba castellanii str. Neff]|uniref:Acetyltransferase, GNAT superfamily protein n=1 Tax=Acanthamoeba castellanii (strain ATCC 30010 / Neff) TaxID=1257118 RepID=L8HBM5_ACACF|nr:acetyltransferase, GNAT superfamily protein [Acanthamoeba castellanii str. Neff]ELR21816.1 acetyltransferase, GNAT superfamily protein [Acanthamoeba castellanii str. Neff]
MKAVAVEVRPLRGLEEADEAARVCKRAFNRIQEPQFGRLVSFPDEALSCRAHRYFASLERTYAVVACNTETGAIIGSNYLDQRDEVASVGPISVDPDINIPGVGRALMQAVIDEGVKNGHKSIRLQQEAYNLISFSLYAKLGFEPKDQVSFIMGRCVEDWPEPKLKLVIRPMTADDLPACAALHKRIVGVDRSVELQASLSPQWAVGHNAPLVAVCSDVGDSGNGRIVGYDTSATSLGHGVAECDEVLARLHFALTQQVPPERRDDDVILRVIGRQSPSLMRGNATL